MSNAITIPEYARIATLNDNKMELSRKVFIDAMKVLFDEYPQLESVRFAMENSYDDEGYRFRYVRSDPYDSYGDHILINHMDSYVAGDEGQTGFYELVRSRVEHITDATLETMFGAVSEVRIERKSDGKLQLILEDMRR